MLSPYSSFIKQLLNDNTYKFVVSSIKFEICLNPLPEKSLLSKYNFSKFLFLLTF